MQHIHQETRPDLTPEEAAILLHVDRRTVLNLIRAGKLPAYCVSAGIRPRYRVRPQDLEAFRQQQTVCHTNSEE